MTSTPMTFSQEILASAKREQLRLAGTRLFAKVVWVVDTDIALKIPDEPGDADAIEKWIYECLGDHPYILRTYGDGESIIGKGLVLQYLSAGTIGTNLELEKFRVERMQWPIQAAEAIRYIHSRGVIHCDISIHNFLTQNNGSIALADFCGSILGGSEAIVTTSARYSRPLSLAQEELNQTVKDDIFALGTVIYEISVGHQLYPAESNKEIYQLFQKREFPDINILPELLRIVVDKCWRDQYNSAQEVTSDLDLKPLCRHSARLSFSKYFGLSLGVLLVLLAIRRKSSPKAMVLSVKVDWPIQTC